MTRSLNGLALFAAVSVASTLPACGEPTNDAIDRSGQCPAEAPSATLPPIGADNIVYLDDGLDTFVPARDAPVPGLRAMAVSGDSLFLARVFRKHAGDPEGAVDIVEMKTDVRADRCSAQRRWSSKSDEAVLDHLGVWGNEVYFLDEGPSALRVGGGEATRLSPVPLDVFIADSSIVIGTTRTPELESDLLFGPRSGALRSIAKLDGVGPGGGELTQDDASVYVGSGIKETGGKAATIDKQTGKIEALRGFEKACGPLVAVEGALWGLCFELGHGGWLMRRDPAGKIEVLHKYLSSAPGLVADRERAYWVDEEGGSRIRLRSLDARAPRDEHGELPVETLADVTPLRTMLLARSGAWLYVATEEANCVEPVPSGKITICARERVTVRVTRHAVGR
jgi:hypothetical protein